MVEEGFNRRLAAVAVADVVGYTRLIARNEVATLKSIDECHVAVSRCVASAGGRLVDFVGDNFLAEFSSTLDAIESCRQLLAELAEQTRAASDAAPIVLRIGIASGEVVSHGDRIAGDPVNIAARLQARAVPGGIAVTGAVFDAISERSDLEFEDLGSLTLKNVGRTIRVLRTQSLYPLPKSLTGHAARPPPPGVTGRPLVAVLPLNYAAADPKTSACAERLFFELVGSFARGQTCSAVSGRSSAQYAGATTDLRALGTSLGAQFVLDGSLRRSETHFEATLQLADTSNGQILWSNSISVDPVDPGRASVSAVAQCAPIVSSTLARRRDRYPQSSLTAWDLAQQAEELLALHPMNKERAVEAIELATRAVDLDRTCSLALATRGVARATLWALGLSDAPEQFLDLADKDTRQALELSPTDSTIVYDRAYVVSYTRGCGTAVTLLRKSLELNPASAQALANLGYQLARLGRPDEGIEKLREAFALSPHDPRRYLWYWWSALVHSQLGDRQQALNQCEAALAEHEEFAPSWLTYIALLVLAGDITNAKRAAGNLRRLDPTMSLARIGRMLASGQGASPQAIERLSDLYRRAGLS
jgi:class 3 adenylate cyclase/TolB-like protein/Tfp pilus assembly protein PilF